MRPLLTALLLLLLGIACAAEANPPVARWTISAQGYGSVRIGMNVKHAEKLLGTALLLEESPMVGNCFVATPKKGHKGLYLMVDSGAITHVGTSAGTIASDTGFKVGDLASRLRTRYGKQLEIEDHKYQDGMYYYVWEPNKQRGKRYVIDSKLVVIEIRGGDESIQRVEGPCS